MKDKVLHIDTVIEEIQKVVKVFEKENEKPEVSETVTHLHNNGIIWGLNRACMIIDKYATEVLKKAEEE